MENTEPSSKSEENLKNLMLDAVIQEGQNVQLDPKETSLESSSDIAGLEMGSDVEGIKSDILKVTYYLRDVKRKMIDAWSKVFKEHEDRVKISLGDIFQGAPAVDAIVSPANSFGFMDGGIDMVYTDLFGWQMQERLQKVIREGYDGENIVGNAIIIQAYEKEPEEKIIQSMKKNNTCGGQPIKFLISAPTMRVPKDVMDTSNAFLAFRAVILAVQKHNRNPDNQPIRSVLCPGLGTAVGRMPFDRCAYQMLQAYEIHDLKIKDELLHPENLWIVTYHDNDMEKYCDGDR